MYKIVLFDLDGTLTDPGEGITNSAAYALNKFGISVTDKTMLYKFIGPPLKDSFMKYYGFSESDALLAIDYYREYFGDKGIFENSVYIGIEQMLLHLKNSGRNIVLATSKPQKYAVEILKHFKLYKYFDFIGGATMDGARSEKSDVIKYVLNNINFDSLSDIVMVGDREHDIIGAKQNDIDSIGVLFGYGTEEELESAGATHIAKSVDEILKFL